MLTRCRQIHPNISRALLGTALLCSPMILSGCWLFMASQEVSGKKIDAQYSGLADKSVAIVIYSDQATTNEFPAAREEISAFVSARFREHLPTARLVDYHDVMNWQDDTLNWFALPEKDIGKHFSVDRVLYIELLDYSVSMSRGYGDLQGHLRANCKVFETDTPTPTPAWTGLIDINYPKDRPTDVDQSSPESVRARTLQEFAEAVVSKFYDHHELDKPLKDQN